MLTVDFIENVQITSLKNKKALFSFLSKEIQKHIIGYIRNPIGEFEPALTPTHSYMPLSSFGISDIHYGENVEFISFPENKKLADMLEDPVNFNEWCKKNLQSDKNY